MPGIDPAGLVEVVGYRVIQAFRGRKQGLVVAAVLIIRDRNGREVGIAEQVLKY